MCGDSSGNQHVKCTGKKSLKLPKKINKLENTALKHINCSAVGQQMCCYQNL